MTEKVRAHPRLAAAAAVLLGYVMLAVALPNGLPFGVLLLGVVLGGVSSLTAIGLVIVYRSARIVNFAQAEIGGLASTVAVILVAGVGWPYLVAVPIGLLAALVTGALIDLTVIRQLFTAPRLIVTVATIGIAQVLGAAELGLPTLTSHLRPLTTFTTPFTVTFTVGPIVFDGNDLVALVAVPIVLAGLAWFFGRTNIGIGIRGAADSRERALLLGIPVRRLSLISWIVAAGLSGVGSLLATPILGTQLGVVAGPVSLLAPLTAAVLAGMESIPVACLAAVGINVFEQAVLWSYPRSSTIDVALFGIILVALLVRRRQFTRTDDAGLAGHVAVREVKPIASTLARLPETRALRAGVYAVLAAAAVGGPWAVSNAHRLLLGYIAIYGVIAVSLVILTGWSGQISLGQFAFAGVGAGLTAGLLAHTGADLFVCLTAAAAGGAVTAIVIGIPALRMPGLFLAVATLAFAVPVSTYLLNNTYFPWLSPNDFPRPILFSRWDLEDPLAFYYLTLLALLVAIGLARNYRETRLGRITIATRDNARGASAYGISPTRSKLIAFAISGALAGVAGGLYAVGLRGIAFSGFNPVLSLQVFTMVVVGGLVTITGGLLGAIYVQGAQFFLHGAWQLLATGGGLLTVIQLLPGGLADLVFRTRDAALTRIAYRHQLGLDGQPLPAGTPAPSLARTLRVATTELRERLQRRRSRPAASAPNADALLSCTGIDAGYGKVQVLSSVDLAVPANDVVALLGTNGAGKSTLLKVVAGLLPARAGHVVFDGEDITTLAATERVRRGIAMVPGGRGVFPSLSVTENLRLAAWTRRHDPQYVDCATRQALELFPALTTRMNVRAGLLSGGEQQMLAIAQALLCDPRLLLIDELSLGLAPTIVAQLLTALGSLVRSGVTVVIVEQSVNVATSVAHTAYFMERGEVRYSGDTAALADRSDLVRSVFFGGSRTRSRTRKRPAATAPDTDRPTVLTATGVARSFGGVRALTDASVTVSEGEIVGLIGANGAGKTTLLDVCSGFIRPDHGRITFGGHDVTQLSPAARAELGIGRVFQDARMFPSMTVVEALTTARERYVDVRDPLLCLLRTGAVRDSETDTAATVEQLIDRLHLERYRNAFISELSTGTRRVVEIGCVLAHEPTLILLDEPSSGIAQRESEALRDLLLELRNSTGAAFLVVEHDIPLVSSIADRLVCMNLGTILSEGTPQQVLNDPAVIAAYLGEDERAIRRSDAAMAR